MYTPGLCHCGEIIKQVNYADEALPNMVVGIKASNLAYWSNFSQAARVYNQTCISMSLELNSTYVHVRLKKNSTI